MAAEALGSPEGWPPRRYGGTVADCVPHRREQPDSVLPSGQAQ
jgi:hypothetical protein